MGSIDSGPALQKQHEDFRDDEVLAKLDWTRARSEIRMDLAVVSLFAKDATDLGCPLVHIAGTNGKGSAVWSIARRSPQPCGCFTSPFIESVTECIMVDGESIPVADCVAIALAIEAEEKAKGVSLTAFERLTVVALRYFKQRAVALAVIECGMGGRLDSTNIVRPTVCVITSVGLDHMAVLGNTVEEIAREKGGIFKPGAHVVLGPESPALLDEMAASVGAKSVRRLPALDGETYGALADRTAHAVVELLGYTNGSSHANSHWSRAPPCRFEVFADGHGREFVLDAAHNAPGMEALCAAARARYSPEKRIAVLAVIARDKQIGEMLETLRNLTADVTLCAGTTPRACKFGPSLEVALAGAAHRADVIIVCGTFEVMAAARGLVTSYANVAGESNCPRVLVVDHDDSFTENIIHMLVESGAVPERIRTFDMKVPPECSSYSGIVLSPGPGAPWNQADVGVSAALLDKQQSLPILGVCLGHQLLTHVYGGDVGPSDFPMHGRASLVTLEDSGVQDELFRGVPRQFKAVRYHSLAASRLPDCLVPLGFAEDSGQRTLMALRHRTLPRWGLQYHPESIGTCYGKEVLSNFVEVMRRHSTARRTASPLRASVPLPLASAPPAPDAPHKSSGSRSSPSSAGAASSVRPSLRFSFQEVSRAVPAQHGTLDADLIFDIFKTLEEPRVLLESSLVVPGFSRYSFLAGAPYLGPLSYSVSYWQARGEVTCEGPGAPFESRPVSDVPSFLSMLAEMLSERSARSDAHFDFAGGFVGYLGYELNLGLLPPQSASKASTSTSSIPGDVPDAWFLFVDRFLAVDGLLHRVYACSLESADSEGSWSSSEEARSLASVPGTPDSAATDASQPQDTAGFVSFQCSHSREEYLETVRKCQELIRAGESYELCMTVRYDSADKVDAEEVYKALRRVNPAPHACLFNLRGAAVLSSSPENFMRVDRGGVVSSKPMKGTARRNLEDSELDAVVKSSLASSEKDRAENLMIVDLVRHDLSRVCEAGSVRCPHLLEVETYASVHQMVSVVRGQLPCPPRVLQGANPEAVMSAVAACFPPGSMTGAPKARSVALLRDLEKNLPRGVYSGVAGYFSSAGAADLCVLIRSLVIKEGGGVHIGSGSAITLLSDPEAELEEVHTKVERLLQAVHSCTPVKVQDHWLPTPIPAVTPPSPAGAIPELTLLETMLWEKDATTLPYLWDVHHQRIERAAADLRVELPPRRTLEAAIEDACKEHQSGVTLRVRMLIQRHRFNSEPASVSVTATVLPAINKDLGFPWDLTSEPRRVCMDVQPAVHSGDRLLLHKTLWRSPYDQARRRMLPAGTDLFDVILFNERYEITETSIANIAVESVDGRWLTPPLTCGLLAGVQREAFLAEGLLHEAVITVNDLIKAVVQGRRVLCFNSVRGAYLVSIVHATCCLQAIA